MDVDQMMITLLNMSITAGFAALLVMALRLLYRRLPKRFSCVLWLVVIFRFLCPFSLQSPNQRNILFLDIRKQGIRKFVRIQETPIPDFIGKILA